jgi:hypothetical protein
VKTEAAASPKMVPFYKVLSVTSQKTIILTRNKFQYRQENAIAKELNIPAAMQITLHTHEYLDSCTDDGFNCRLTNAIPNLLREICSPTMKVKFTYKASDVSIQDPEIRLRVFNSIRTSITLIQSGLFSSF